MNAIWTADQCQAALGRFSWAQTLTPAPAALQVIRYAADMWLRRWQMTGVTDACLSTITELCSNAKHTPDRYFCLTLSCYSTHVRIDVRDHSPVVPAIPKVPDDLPDFDAENGRGLYITACHADRLGVNVLTDGKVIWAEVDPLDCPAAV
ncbi:ATP-binding protein [Sphaerisporangium sp. NPDC051017]|uniref:ATP-binding protein n=1 Tax=unclassified Sphaerisporangium TaxID=2630420 RepID=UPI0034094C4C